MSNVPLCYHWLKMMLIWCFFCRSQSKLTASRFLRIGKIVAHVKEKLESVNAPTNAAAGSTASLTATQDTSSEPGTEGLHALRPKSNEEYEILCNDVVLPADMTLAVARQFVWKQMGTELVLSYRIKREQ